MNLLNLLRKSEKNGIKNKKELNRKFENQVFKLSKNKSTVCIKEAALEFVRKSGHKEGIKDWHKKEETEKVTKIIILIFQKFPNWTDKQVTELVDEPIGFIKKTRKEWNKKQAIAPGTSRQL